MKVLTMGVYDLFHAGHVAQLRRCRELAGDGTVVVGLNTDEFTETYKGRRPVIPYAEREAVLLACRYVDEVVPNDQGNGSALGLIDTVNPDVIGASAEWGERWFGQVGVTREQFAERDIRVEWIDYTAGVSSTDIRGRL